MHFLVCIASIYFSKQKSISLFIIIRHEHCYSPVYNPLMKLSSILFRKFLHLFLYLLSYEYVEREKSVLNFKIQFLFINFGRLKKIS